MKTAEEWTKTYDIPALSQRSGELKPIIEQIQQDAFLTGKAEGLAEGRERGLREAAEMVRFQPYHSDFSLGHNHGAEAMSDKILSAINKKESPE